MATPSLSATPDQIQARIQMLLTGPAAKPPEGVTSNFIDPANLEATTIVLLTVGTALTTLAVSICMYTKSFLIRSLACEDCKPQPFRR
jgi:hypothetical protein